MTHWRSHISAHVFILVILERKDYQSEGKRLLRHTGEICTTSRHLVVRFLFLIYDNTFGSLFLIDFIINGILFTKEKLIMFENYVLNEIVFSLKRSFI